MTSSTLTDFTGWSSIIWLCPDGSQYSSSFYRPKDTKEMVSAKNLHRLQNKKPFLIVRIKSMKVPKNG